MLLQVGKKKISDPEDVFDASFYISAGDVVPITVMRGNQKMIFHVHATMLLHPAVAGVGCLNSPGTIPGVPAMFARRRSRDACAVGGTRGIVVSAAHQ